MSSSTTDPRRMRLTVLISGAGSNMLAIAQACRSGQINADIAVIADTATAAGLGRAQALGLSTVLVDRFAYRNADRPDRAAFETALAAAIDSTRADLVVLAGFMRVLSADFVSRYSGRMLNIHPSLLPRHKGLDTHARALAAGDREHGASVHFVTAELDGGPVLAQSVVPVLAGDSVASLSARVHAGEHIIYPMVIEWFTRGRLQWNAGRPTLDGVPLTVPVQLR
ncbi:MAG: phosphoribosylglycinamide formyltransferase [Steroidobacteraceae bacterium]